MTSREPLQIVEIDMDYCELSYGLGACAAALGTTGSAKCFNTFKTCQDTGNFDRGSITLRFANNQEGLPAGQTIFPALQSVSTNPTKINIGGIDKDTGTLGRRERVTIRMSDFAYSDVLTDKYYTERLTGAARLDGQGYNPQERGTFFGRMRVRNPFYYGRAIRVLNGFVGQEISEMRTKHYVIDEWSGPDAGGGVVIVAKDILALAEDDKAQCPRTSQGKLDVDVDDSETTITLVPETVGEEYPASGYASIGNEIVTFTRVGDVVTLTARAQGGTEAQRHDAGDTFQLAYRAENLLLSQAVEDLLVNYSNVSDEYIDTAEWANEVETWLAGLRIETIIPKPTGVLNLLAELGQLGSSIWWDAVDQKIKLRLNRLVDLSDSVATVSDASNILEGSATVKDRPDLRLSQFVVYHDAIDYTASMTNPENFRKAEVAVDLGAEGDNEYAQAAFETVYSRWVQPGSDSAVRSIAQRVIGRYSDIPTDISFDVDVKDIGDVSIGSIFDLKTRLLTDFDGAPKTVQAQVTQFEETIPGHRVSIVAQTYAFNPNIGFITANDAPGYSGATVEQKRLGAFIAPDSGIFADGLPAYELV